MSNNLKLNNKVNMVQNFQQTIKTEAFTKINK